VPREPRLSFFLHTLRTVSEQLSCILGRNSFLDPTASALACSGTFGGKTYDLSSLISPTGSYVWSQDLYATGGALLYAPASYDKQHVTFEMQVCVPIGKSVSSNCTNPTSAVNMITADGKCVSLGSGAQWKMYQVRVAAQRCVNFLCVLGSHTVFHCHSMSRVCVHVVRPERQNPSNDGVYISYDEGDKVDRLQVYKSLVFFVCTPGGGAGAPAFEHQKSNFQNHIGFPTAVVC
jgi:hypothetical protein